MEKKAVNNVNNVKKVNNKKNENKNSKKKKSKSKINIKDPKRFLCVICIFVAIIVLIVVIIKTNSKVEITDSTDISNLNAKKYSSEILDEYNKEESKQKFLEDYDLVQGAVGLYIMNNSTSEENSFTNLITNLKGILDKGEWEKLEISKPIFWNGKWNINDEGILNFTFNSKNIEPTWINSEELLGKVVAN